MRSIIRNLSEHTVDLKTIFFKRKNSVLVLAAFLSIGNIKSQTLCYDNFEGTKTIRYSEKTGVLDSLAKNPGPDSVNNSKKCGKYIRNAGKKFDNIKMKLPANLTDVDSYATYLGIPPRFKMKVYTSAPAGTLVEILLGRESGNADYPSGTHSQYQAYTTVSNKWETLEFKFSQIPQGSETTSAQIDQATLLFNPNSSTSDTYYFDELAGPPLLTKETTPPVAEKKDGDTPKKNAPQKKKTKK